jgi:hypothetical protein
MERPRPVSDLGFAETAGERVLHDGFRVDHLAAAKGGRERCASSYEYLRKTLKHSMRLADEAGDAELLDLLDQRCEWLAGQIVEVVSEVEAELRARGYDRRA